ncbi:ADP-ribosylation factor-like protein 6-interacting protein 6 [Cyprinodon tularosa]|uniref:ADP-ribosylation factor-like protein 6-interacting protein 6 n=1 Tax=Cyprinodon tularosa TaxID=77115 RepID=UPI0018E27862|nr:ADP-ribosylation factor-like protein 6-interacting protein 6 [Cyprinodon tularosa]
MSARALSGRPRSGGVTPWFSVSLSALGSAAAVAAAGSFCGLIYPILRDLRAERLRGENGTEERILGFWSILVISTLVGCVSCISSWILTYLDSFQPGGALPGLLSLPDVRDASSRGFNLSFGLALLNGIMAALTVIWSLS